MLTDNQKDRLKALLLNCNDDKFLELIDLMTIEATGESTGLAARGKTPDFIVGYQSGLQSLKAKIITTSKKDGVI
ncbi:MAG: hypothetical protein ACRDCE_00880 [Cetobacterium sp.]|uniref:hypothetical protein n=1 Tax=Cetobacterium sp. TaxID=2071632 RepID=UPI003EE4BFC9